MPDLRPQILLIILSLLLVGISFWAGSDLLTKHLLALSYRTIDKLQADQLTQVILMMSFTVIDTQIHQDQTLTKVNINIGNSLLKTVEMEFPKSNFDELAIAKTFGLYPQVKKIDRNQPVTVNIPVALKAIKAEIKKEKESTFIEVITANKSLRKLSFVFPFTEINMIESMTAQVLNLQPKDVQELVRYQVRKSSM
ncbi:hypothetical protein ACN23B_00350 [Anabaena sp. FACHB-709]|uniref:Uncharacterized protein n=2 Tax=Nostocaceae TaxID=1162 RepID=A0A1Z4KPX1_ANAVA|nr:MULTISPECIES: hypothetical protein [Nostocaceae]BAY71042.1 hypothetical protein NIES23_38550 [Trichormus variabilis NIES-23]HBW29258.1 hypothetical protein [Nostoc sp. UBA8866]MBD2171843.1 hypothetical protein [Anabaena cylindrica FACHB-318]MBD2263421.1 hypothetical protein [Anabaena sp. FACHB-709]MBD2272965.1 hypothetical protein [Nostoc sp. PCC 7120 = FACHB-418]